MKTKHIIIYSVLSALLISVFAFCALNVDAAEETSGECGENLTWRYDSDTKTLYIEGYGEMTEYVIGFPWDGLTIENIVLPDGLTTIAASAFENSVVRSVVIPDSVTIIGNSAFDGCFRLMTVEIGSGVTEIRGEAFRSCNMLESVVIPGNVKIIDHFAFANCEMLNSVTISDGVEVIGDYAFNWCFRLKQAYIGNQVTTIGQKAFEACALKNVVIPESVTTFYMDSFDSCKVLETVMVESVEAISLIVKESEAELPWGIESLVLDGRALQQVPCIATDISGITTMLGDTISYVYDSDVWEQAIQAHRYSEDYNMDSQFHWSYCLDCGKSSENEYHNYSIEIITPPTYESEGQGKYYCQCGWHYYSTIPVLVPEESEEDIIIEVPLPVYPDTEKEASSFAPATLIIIVCAVVAGVGGLLVNVAIVVLIIVLVKKKKNKKTSE